MKVQRYTKGATNVAELQSQRSSAITPAEGAAAAAAPYAAVGKIAGIAADQITEYGVRRIEEENKNDATQMATNTALTQTSLKNTKTQAELEGWPEEQYLANVDAEIRNYIDSGSMIGERNQGEALKAFNANALLWRAEADTNAMVMKTNRINKEQEAAYQAAEANGDYDTMKFLSDMRFAADGKESEHKARNQNINALIDIKEAMDGAREVWLSPEGVAGVKRLRKEYLENPNKNPKVQASIMSGLNTMVNNINKSEQQEKDLALATYELEVEAMIDAYDNPAIPDPDPTTILWKAQSDPRVTPRQAVALYKRAKTAQRSAKVAITGYDNFVTRVNNDELLEGSPENRKYLSQFIASETLTALQKAESEGRELTVEDGYTIRDKTILRLGFADAETKSQLKAGMNSAEGMASQSRTIAALTSDPTKNIDLGLTDAELHSYMDVEFVAMGNGGKPEDFLAAATGEFENINDKLKDPNEMAFRQAKWETEWEADDYDKLGSSLEDIWDDMWQEAPYDTWLTWGVPKPDRDSVEFYDFVNMANQSFMYSGNGEKMENFLKKAFHRKNPPNNINGKMETQRNGVTGDANWLREDWYDKHKSTPWLVVDKKGGSYVLEELTDFKELKFVLPDRTVDGEYDYEVYYRGSPIIQAQASDAEAVGPIDLRNRRKWIETITNDDLNAIKSRTENKEQIELLREDIADYEKDLSSATGIDAEILQSAIDVQKKTLEQLENP